MNTNKLNMTLLGLDIVWKSKLKELTPLTYIFGLNGSGKTSFSRGIKYSGSDYDVKVFNNDYISENIFEPTFNNNLFKININKNNNKNTYEIMFGKELKALNTENNELLVKKEHLNKEIVLITNTLNNKFENIIEKNNFHFDLGENILNIRRFNISEISTSEISRIEKKSEMIINIDYFNHLISLINNISVFISNFKALFLKYNKLVSSIEKPLIIIKIHEIASSSKEKSVEFCGEYFLISDVKAHFQKMTKDKKNIIDEILQMLSDFRTLIKDINMHTHFSKLNEYDEFKKGFNEMRIIDNKLSGLDDIINSNRKITFKLKFTNQNMFDEKKEKDYINKWFEDNKESMIDNHDLFFSNNKEYKDNELNIGINNASIYKNTQKIGEDVVSKINGHLTALGSEDIHITLATPKSNITKISKLYFKNSSKDMANLSEGEKKNLALSYFLVDVEKTLIENKTPKMMIIFDDPFDSNDHQKMDSFGELKFNLMGEMESYRLSISKFIEKYSIDYKEIILTHNIAVLSSLTRNLIDKNHDNNGHMFSKVNNKAKDMSLLEMRKNGLTTSIADLNFGHLFPLEGKHNKVLRSIVSRNIKENIIDSEKRTLVVLILLLTKINDGLDMPYRNKCINTISGKWIGHLSHPGNKELENISCHFKSFIADNKETMELNIDEKFIKKELTIEGIKDIELFVSYLRIFSLRADSIVSIGNPQALKRLRHKTNYHFNAVGYAIQE